MKATSPFFTSTITMSDSSSAPILPFKPATVGMFLDDLDKEMDVHAYNRPAVRHSIFLSLKYLTTTPRIRAICPISPTISNPEELRTA